jgi:hypothetical protein
MSGVEVLNGRSNGDDAVERPQTMVGLERGVHVGSEVCVSATAIVFNNTARIFIHDMIGGSLMLKANVTLAGQYTGITANVLAAAVFDLLVLAMSTLLVRLPGEPALQLASGVVMLTGAHSTGVLAQIISVARNGSGNSFRLWATGHVLPRWSADRRDSRLQDPTSRRCQSSSVSADQKCRRRRFFQSSPRRRQQEEPTDVDRGNPDEWQPSRSG